MLRAESESINATLVDDLKPFFGPTKPMFQRLPEEKTNLCEASLETIKRQLNDKEFAALIRDNGDVIAVWQAGFLGNTASGITRVVMMSASRVTKTFLPVQR
jgi:hypothetical protein